MTAAELAIANLRVAEAKRQGKTLTIAEAFAPITLGVALQTEKADKTGHVEFKGGIPRWVPGPVRFSR